MTTTGQRFVWGTPKEIKPLVIEVPFQFKPRLRFKNNEFGRVFLRTNDGIREFAIVDKETHWLVAKQFEQRRNCRQ